MSLIAIPANPVPADVVTGTLKTPDGVSLRFARWSNRWAARARFACFRDGRTLLRNISRPCGTCGLAASRSRHRIGAGKGCRTARCTIGARATCAVSQNIRSISTASSGRLFFPIARRQSLRSLMPWARRFCYARPTMGGMGGSLLFFSTPLVVRRTYAGTYAQASMSRRTRTE